MAKKRKKLLVFPVGGLSRENSYRLTPPYTTFDCLNVWPKGSIEKRLRGGNRPGLEKSHPEAIGGAVRLLTSVTYTPGITIGDDNDGIRGEGVYFSYHDSFENNAFPDDWVAGYGASSGPHSVAVGPQGHHWAYSTWAQGQTDSYYFPGAIDFTKPVSLAIRVRPNSDNRYNSLFYLTIGKDNVGGVVDTIRVFLNVDDGNDAGAYSGLVSITGGTPASTALDTGGGFTADEIGWLKLEINGTNVKVYWRDYLAANLTSSGVSWDTSAGFTVGTRASTDSEGRFVRIQGTYSGFDGSDSGINFVSDGLKTELVAIGNSNLFHETVYGSVTQLSTSLTLNTASILNAAQVGQKLYIADWGNLRVSGTDGTVSGLDLDAASVADWTAHGIDADDDVVVLSNVGGATVAGVYKISSIAAGALTLASAPGDGTASYRVERGPKVYDPNAGTLALFTASTGQVPTGQPLMVRYVDRLVFAGGEIAPHAWYMSRHGDETDWDYSQTDAEAAVAGTASEAGTPGKAVTALIAYKDDYLIIACKTEMWLMRGDPGYGGSLDKISGDVGIISPNAWCLGPQGELIFLSQHGIYILPQISEGSSVVPLSSRTLPREFLDIDPGSYFASLEFDVRHNGVHVYIPLRSSVGGNYWFVDWESKTFWPMDFDDDHEPTATYVLPAFGSVGGGIILGGRDGYLRRYDDQSTSDDGVAFTNYVLIGPVALGQDGRTGKVSCMDAVLAENSGTVTWSYQVADTFEASVDASAADSGTWAAGLNATVVPVGTGQAMALKLTGPTAGDWALENILITVHDIGPRRIA
jgi:hypothetical protein